MTGVCGILQEFGLFPCCRVTENRRVTFDLFLVSGHSKPAISIAGIEEVDEAKQAFRPPAIASGERVSANRWPRRSIFLGANLVSQDKKCLVMDTEQYRYQRFCSDLSGFDPAAHGGDILQLICVVRDWLRSNLEPNEKIPGGEYIFARHKKFLAKLPGLCEQENLNLNSLHYIDYISLLQGWLQGEGLREKQTS
jgi:hypothetical protein